MTQIWFSTGKSRRVLTAGAVSCALLLLAGCTTVEGTNAFQDVGTFEREVMNETAAGIGLIPREEKAPITTPRSPLVMPANADNLPPPTEEDPTALPEDSDNVEFDLAGLSEDELRRLRNARVIDMRTPSGRPLTEDETRQLAAMMQRNGLTVSQAGARPLYLPPDEYFTTVNNHDAVCLAPNGQLVSLQDPNCPAEIRAALQGTQ
ncbi:MAG: hypothetical protein H6873_06350 [Hyphomicrobiaceae bacterium]|nr:hypothetical protein [Hyphomicrobiaceae bacterium]